MCVCVPFSKTFAYSFQKNDGENSPMQKLLRRAQAVMECEMRVA